MSAPVGESSKLTKPSPETEVSLTKTAGQATTGNGSNEIPKIPVTMASPGKTKAENDSTNKTVASNGKTNEPISAAQITNKNEVKETTSTVSSVSKPAVSTVRVKNDTLPLNSEVKSGPVIAKHTESATANELVKQATPSTVNAVKSVSSKNETCAAKSLPAENVAKQESPTNSTIKVASMAESNKISMPTSSEAKSISINDKTIEHNISADNGVQDKKDTLNKETTSENNENKEIKLAADSMDKKKEASVVNKIPLSTTVKNTEIKSSGSYSAAKSNKSTVSNDNVKKPELINVVISNEKTSNSADGAAKVALLSNVKDGKKEQVSTNDNLSKEVSVTGSEAKIISTKSENQVSQKKSTGLNEENQHVSAIITGRCSFDDIPPLPKKIVRIFVSSTFTDTKEERNALMQYVYPKLSEFCREKHGLEFQVVDMRWGVPQAASDNHSTTQLCIQEIKKCQQVSVGPNFVAIVGDKYGYRPIPSEIDTTLYKKLKQNFKKEEIKGEHDWNLVEEWYKQDDNAVPPVYLLQQISAKLEHYNNMENPELRKEAQNNWNKVNQMLTAMLRQAAESAFKNQQLSENEKQMFFRSVTENEIHEGLFEGSGQPQDTCFCIIRKITDLHENLADPKAPRFADVKEKQYDNEAKILLDKLRNAQISQNIPESNLCRLDIEWLTSGAKISIDKFKDIDIAKFVQESLQYQEEQVSKYKSYLEKVCENFFENISHLIDEGGMKERQLYDELTSEILQHWHLAKLRCEVFEGREDILSIAKMYLIESSIPMTIYGNSGCGKTSVMAKIMENVANGTWCSKKGNKFMLIAKFLGTTPNTSNVHQLIVSVCKQIAHIYNVDWEEPEKFSALVKSFHKLLENASEEKPIVLLLDSVDQLMPAYNAFKLGWLPITLPNFVKLIISTINEGYPILKNSIERYGGEMKAVEVKPLGEKLGLEVINKWLSKDRRKMSDQQVGIIKLALQKCSLPLYARIAYDHIKKWKSYDKPGVEELETTVRGAINKLFSSIEEKFGDEFVKHSLSYLTAARYGLSEAELEHLLSLDDKLLNHVFMFWNPPTRRIPPLMWTRIRTEIHSYLVERSADDALVLYWYHRQFIEATKERYLKDSEFSKYIHSNLTEYFTGKWGGGKEKQFEYTTAQMTRFGLKSGQSKADRKVPLQPYIMQGVGNESRYNKRKLSELPFHLIKCKDYKELKKQVFFNYEWLYAKLCSSSTQQLLEEFEIFMQADKFMKKDADMRNLYVNLQLIRPFITRYPNSLAYELLGRMSKFVGHSDAVTSLMQGCDTIGNKHCVIFPLVTSFETADIRLTQNITFRKSEPWQEGGVFTCSADFKTMYIIDYDDQGAPIVLTWDILTGEKINSFSITKTRDENVQGAVDVYIQAEVNKNGKYLVAFYKQKFVTGYTHRYRPHGLVDVIDLDNGNVFRTYEGYLYRQDSFYNPLQYITENHICARFGVKNPIYNITENTKKEINRPTLLSPDEQYLIMCGQKKTELKSFATNEVIGEFDTSEPQVAIAASSNFGRIAMMGSETRQIKIFDLRKKQLHANKKFGFLLKYKRVFHLDDKLAATVADLFKTVVEVNVKGEKEEKTNNRVVMTVAPDDRHLLVIFRGTEAWTGFVWTLGKSNSRKQVESITEKMPLNGKFPQFNFDGTCIAYGTEKDILVYSSEDAQQINKYEMADNIKDFYMSKTSNKIAVMQTQSVVLLNITKSEGTLTSKGNKQMLNKTSEVLIEREINTSFIHKEMIITQMPGSENLEVEELEDIGMAAKTDRLASARSKVRYAIDKQITPDGLKAIHYHTRVQVIDTTAQKIVYTPLKKELILRVSQKSGTVSSESLKIPGMEPGEKAPRIFDLIPGDRIVNENNKVKFRVNKETNFQIMNVPSVITVYSAEEEKLQLMQRISVYQEHIIAVSNKMCVTSKMTPAGHFIKIYDLVSGKNLAIHEIPDGCNCAKFSSDEVQLVTVDRNLTVRVYLSPNYNALEQKIPLQTGQFSAAFIVKDILTFKQNRDFVVVRYGPEGDSTSVRSRYIHINLATKEKSPEMEMKPCFEDISKDGEIGIDATLSVYKLTTGKVIRQVDYAGMSEKDSQDLVPQGQDNLYLRKLRYNDPKASMQLRIRISEDNRFIVYVDKQDDTLHISEKVDDEIHHLFSCHTHIPNLNLSHGLEIRYYGRIIVLRTRDNIFPFAIRPLKEARAGNIKYESEMSRALSIVDNIWASRTKQKLPNITRNEANQMFINKYDLRDDDDDEDEEGDEEREEQNKIFQVKSTAKPSVLIIGESLLSQFKPSRFTSHLSTHLTTVNTADDAIKSLKTLPNTYDAIVLQLVTDDVKYFDTKTCIVKVNSSVELAKKKGRVVVISMAPNRADNQELNQKTEEINQKVKSQFSSTKGVFICNNSNLSENGKPLHKYFKDGVYLSPPGIIQISVNIKNILQSALELDII